MMNDAPSPTPAPTSAGPATTAAGAATAERILAAADELFGEQGYAGVSVRDVAARAGVNKALVFYHHGSKAALFERVLRRYYGEHLDVMRAAVGGEGSRAERLHAVVDAYFDFIDSNRRYPRLVQQEVAGGNEHELIRRNLRALFEWTGEILTDLTPSEGPLAAKHFFVTFSGMVINYFTYGPVLEGMWGSPPLSEESVAERREHVHWVVDLFLEGLQRRDAAAGGPEAEAPDSGTPRAEGEPTTPR